MSIRHRKATSFSRNLHSLDLRSRRHFPTQKINQHETEQALNEQTVASASDAAQALCGWAPRPRNKNWFHALLRSVCEIPLETRRGGGGSTFCRVAISSKHSSVSGRQLVKAASLKYTIKLKTHDSTLFSQYQFKLNKWISGFEQFCLGVTEPTTYMWAVSDDVATREFSD